jgi:hypothetical protein
VAPARPGVKRQPGEGVDAPRLTKGFYHVNISDIGPTVQFVRISAYPPDPVIRQPGQDYRVADALHAARREPTRRGPERLGPER